MSQTARATTILEFLTAANPDIGEPEDGSKTNTRVRGGHFPAQVVEWDDFSIHTFKEIWDKELFDATLSLELGRGLKPFPDHDARFERVAENEPQANAIIDKWNWRIVREALLLVGPLFEPSIWVHPQAFRGPEDPTASSSETVESTEATATEATSVEMPNQVTASSPSTGQASTKADAAKKKKEGGHLRKPDGSAESYQSFLEKIRRHEQGDFKPRPFDERLPKEIKPSRKWSASDILKNRKFFHENGEFKYEMQSKDEVAPIKQIFTYCLESLCRYGCIYTCSELVVLRVGLRLSADPNLANLDSMSPDLLAQEMASNGLMEYAVISWSNWCAAPESGLGFMTVNLASFFVHLLAGGNYQVAPRYPRLLEEPRPKKRAINEDSEIVPAGTKRARQSRGTSPLRRTSHATVTEDDNGSIHEVERPSKILRRAQGSEADGTDMATGGNAERSSSTLVEEDVGSTTSEDGVSTPSGVTETGHGNEEDYDKFVHSFNDPADP